MEQSKSNGRVMLNTAFIFRSLITGSDDSDIPNCIYDGKSRYIHMPNSTFLKAATAYDCFKKALLNVECRKAAIWIT